MVRSSRGQDIRLSSWKQQFDSATDYHFFKLYKLNLISVCLLKIIEIKDIITKNINFKLFFNSKKTVRSSRG